MGIMALLLLNYPMISYLKYCCRFPRQILKKLLSMVLNQRSWLFTYVIQMENLLTGCAQWKCKVPTVSYPWKLKTSVMALIIINMVRYLRVTTSSLYLRILNLSQNFVLLKAQLPRAHTISQKKLKLLNILQFIVVDVTYIKVAMMVVLPNFQVFKGLPRHQMKSKNMLLPFVLSQKIRSLKWFLY